MYVSYVWENGDALVPACDKYLLLVYLMHQSSDLLPSSYPHVLHAVPGDMVPHLNMCNIVLIVQIKCDIENIKLCKTSL